MNVPLSSVTVGRVGLHAGAAAQTVAVAAQIVTSNGRRKAMTTKGRLAESKKNL